MKHTKNKTLRLGLILTGIMLAFILLGCVWTPYDPDGMDVTCVKAAPSLAHPFGTDNFGRDIFSRVLRGAGTTFVIAACTVLIGVVFGLIIGGLTGYYGGWPDELLMRLNDTITAFPSILLALVLIALFGSGKYKIILTLGILFIPSYARMVRTEVARERTRDYVANAKLMGIRDMRILFVHILPNIRPLLLSTAVIGFNNAVLAEASMSYLGIGVQPPDASLGRMLNEAQGYLTTTPWYALAAGITLILLVLGFALLGDGLEERSHA